METENFKQLTIWDQNLNKKRAKSGSLMDSTIYMLRALDNIGRINEKNIKYFLRELYKTLGKDRLPVTIKKCRSLVGFHTSEKVLRLAHKHYTQLKSKKVVLED